MKTDFLTGKPEETQEIAKKFAQELAGGEVLALFGDLGSGKTTFMQGLAKGLGIKQRIISPTFILQRSYKVKSSQEQGIKHLHHLDLYRLKGKRDIQGLSLSELFRNDSVVAIEWADKIKDLLPQQHIEIHFTYVAEEVRRIQFFKKHE